jgi:hypothetical protein
MKQSREEAIAVVGAQSWFAAQLPFLLSTSDRRAINLDHWDAYTAFAKKYHHGIHEKLYHISLLDLTHPIHSHEVTTGDS